MVTDVVTDVTVSQRNTIREMSIGMDSYRGTNQEMTGKLIHHLSIVSSRDSP